ncbi:hypothetical protein SAMN05216480_106142 [Pustulibacterium marinum]|uniref:Uncharacterized protein n=1 Tax=Pustulibacterium marinum TaxID=1224947 RepID=A0A1I7GZX5_9FLAO|nr:hypothetical protein [Pustulibacterium marinum]SFU54014.1 hypothetical protein SAMN05216480_106142 [Pustulibacterium marinum]
MQFITMKIKKLYRYYFICVMGICISCNTNKTLDKQPENIQEDINLNLESKTANATYPKTIAEMLIVNDTTIENHSKLKVYQVFDSQSQSRRLSEQLMGALFRSYIPLCIDNGYTALLSGYRLDFHPHKVVLDTYDDLSCKNKIEGISFTTNSEYTELENGEYDVKYILEKRTFPSRFGTIEIEQQMMQCDDTGKNPLTLYVEGGNYIKFHKIGNISFFEEDFDKDGKKELLIFNYFSCKGILKVYKIDN